MSVNTYDPNKVENDGLTPLAGISDSSKYVWKTNALPTASADIEGEQYLLLGTQVGYTKGCIYECVEVTPATDPKTYTWTAITGTAVTKNATDKVEPDNHALVESNAVSSAIAQAISTVFTPHGNLTCAELLPALLIAANVGNLYNMTDSGTTTSDFVGGAGQTINVGDTVGIITTGPSEYKFNLMPGLEDLSQYANVFYGYLNPTDGLFYKEDTYTTEIPAKADALFVDVVSWVPYAYDETNLAYVAVGGGLKIWGPDHKANWDALSVAEKIQYDEAHFDDDEGAGVDAYSTTETKTNKVWIDGKPIYRKVFNTTTPATADVHTNLIALPTNTQDVINMYGFVLKANYKLPLNIKVNDQDYVISATSNTYIRMAVGTEETSCSAYITLEYTKTTD